MEPSALKAQMQQKTLKNFYIFTGPEWYVQRAYINQLAKVSCKSLRYIDCLADIAGKVSTKSFLKQSYTYVVRDDKDLLQNEDLQSKVEKLIGDNILVLLVTNLDKRTKFYKKFKDDIIVFEPLNTDMLKKYLAREIQLSSYNLDRLIAVCEGDYGRCLLEVNKIKHFIEGYTRDKQNKLPDDGGFTRLLNSGVIYQPPQDAIFDFVDAVLDRKVNLAFNLYTQCVAVGEAVMVMLSVLYSNTKAVLQVQNCQSKDVTASTGLVYWQVQNARKHVGKYRNSELLTIMSMCQEAQQGIVTGIFDEAFCIEHILVSVL